MHTYSTAQQAHTLVSVLRAFTGWVVTVSAKNGGGLGCVCMCVGVSVVLCSLLELLAHPPPPLAAWLFSERHCSASPLS